MQHAMASLRHFACKEMPQTVAATPIAIRLAPTRCLDIRAPFRKWHSQGAVEKNGRTRFYNRGPAGNLPDLFATSAAPWLPDHSFLSRQRLHHV
jgi:hypothetical protein